MFLQYAQFYGKFTEGVSEIHGKFTGQVKTQDSQVLKSDTQQTAKSAQMLLIKL